MKPAAVYNKKIYNKTMCDNLFLNDNDISVTYVIDNKAVDVQEYITIVGEEQNTYELKSILVADSSIVSFAKINLVQPNINTILFEKDKKYGSQPFSDTEWHKFWNRLVLNLIKYAVSQFSSDQEVKEYCVEMYKIWFADNIVNDFLPKCRASLFVNAEYVTYGGDESWA